MRRLDSRLERGALPAPTRRRGSARSTSARPRSPRGCASSAPRSRATTPAASRCSSGSLKACVPFRRRPLARDRRSRIALDFVELAGYGARRDRRPRADPLPQGPRRRDRGPRRRDRRRGRRHRADAATTSAARFALRSPASLVVAARSSTGPTGGSSTTCRSATSASRPRRVLRRLRLRPRRALPQPARPAPCVRPDSLAPPNSLG